MHSNQLLWPQVFFLFFFSPFFPPAFFSPFLDNWDVNQPFSVNHFLLSCVPPPPTPPLACISFCFTVTEPWPSIHSAHILSWNLQREWLWPSWPKAWSSKTGGLAVSVLLAPVLVISTFYFVRYNFCFLLCYHLWYWESCQFLSPQKRKTANEMVPMLWWSHLFLPAVQ